MREQGLVCAKQQLEYNQLLSGVDDWLVESLEVREKTCKGNIMVGGCQRHPIMVSKWKKPSSKPLSHRPWFSWRSLTSLDSCWKISVVGHEQSRRFLEGVRNNILKQVLAGPTNSDPQLHLLFTDMEEQVEDVEISNSHDYGNYEMVGCKILNAVRKESSRGQTQVFGRVYLSSFRKLVSGMPREAALKGKLLRKAGRPLRTCMPQMQEQPIPVFMKTSRCIRRVLWLSRELMMELQCKKASCSDAMEAGTCCINIQEYYPGMSGWCQGS